MAKENRVHLRFNPANQRHAGAAAFFGNVKDRYKMALIVAALEEYQRTHPYGIDYAELSAINKESWASFVPKDPIAENLKAKKPIPQKPAPVSPDAPAMATEIPQSPLVVENGADDGRDSAIDQALGYFNLDDDDD